MDSKAGYNEAYFQEIYNKQNDSRLINDTFQVKVRIWYSCPNKKELCFPFYREATALSSYKTS